MALVLCLLSIAGVAYSYEIGKVENVTFELPRTYLPAALPRKPLDERLRVGLVLPTFDPNQSAFGFRAMKWVGVWPKPENVLVADKYILDAASPAAAALPRVMKRLFPRTEVLESAQHGSGYDIIFKVAVTSYSVVAGHGGVEIVGTMTAAGPDGFPITTIDASGGSRFTKAMYWSTRTRTNAAGIPALEAMLEDLVGKLLSDPRLKAHLRERAAERARPPGLETTARFDDASSVLPNGRLDAGETAKLHLRVRNSGPGPAFGVRLRVPAMESVATIPVDSDVGDLAAGVERNVTVAVTAAVDVSKKRLELPIDTTEKRGYGGRRVVVEVATEELIRPRLEIVDISLREQGDGDGRPSNGETLEAVVLVRNSGPGDAVGASVLLSSAIGGVQIGESKLSRIPANAVREAHVPIRLPVLFDAQELSLTARVVEGRGPEVAQASKTATWPVHLKRPAVEVTYRMHDGNSPGSQGDRDGIANNGETLELVLTPVNRGALAARNVWISVASRQAGVALSADKFKAGDLPAFAEGTEHRVQLVIPRALGREAAIDRLPLTIAVTQDDFPSREQSIVLAFAARRPELVANVTSLSPLVEGSSAVFTLELRNDGLLAAEGVRVEMSCDSDGLELLDDVGAPTRKLRFDVGMVGAKKSLSRFRFKAHVRRNMAEAVARLKVIAWHRDFPSVDWKPVLAIVKEEAAVIPAVVAPATERRSVAAAAAPAIISFQSHQSGRRLMEHAILLPFEVQSQADVELVRLEHNGRAIDLPATTRARSEGSYLWQYEPRVELDYGVNLFQVVVVTVEGARNSRTLTLERERPQGRIWVAVVGISEYADPTVRDLQFARDDAAAVLAYYQRFGIPPEQTIRLLDDQATLTNIKRTLGTELVGKATSPEDTVILYFAGHGEKESDAGSADADGFSKYLLPYDADPADLFGSALSMEELLRILQRLRPERVVLIIDSCFSGAAGGRTLSNPSFASRSAAVSDEFLSRMIHTGKGRVILTASSSNEVAEEKADLGHGIFTYYLLKALEGEADIDGDERIDVDEVYKFVSQKVSAATRGRQNPVKKSPSLTGTVFLGKVTSRNALPTVPGR